MPSSTRRAVTVQCLYCKKDFQSTLRWEGLPEKDYCSTPCEEDDVEYDTLYGNDTDDFDYTKFRGDY